MSTVAKIHVMRAFLDGEAIEVCDTGTNNWRPTMCPQWNWVDDDYRVAPRVYWKNLYDRVAVYEVDWHRSLKACEQARCKGFIGVLKRTSVAGDSVYEFIPATDEEKRKARL